MYYVVRIVCCVLYAYVACRVSHGLCYVPYVLCYTCYVVVCVLYDVMCVVCFVRWFVRIVRVAGCGVYRVSCLCVLCIMHIRAGWCIT